MKFDLTKFITYLFLFLVYSFMLLPIFILVVLSFNQASMGSHWQGFTTQWYFQLFERPDILESLYVSLKIAFLASIFSSLFGLSIGLTMARAAPWMQIISRRTTYLPIVLPDIVIGLAFLSLFIWINMPLGIWTVMIAHTAFGSAYVARLVYVRATALDPLIEEAALDLGATQSKVFFQVLLPQLFSPLLAGALMVFVLSFDDFIIAFFTAGAGATTLTLKIYSLMKFGVTPDINALSSLVLIFTIMILVLVFKLQSKRE